jgi:hypothetical protein
MNWCPPAVVLDGIDYRLSERWRVDNADWQRALGHGHVSGPHARRPQRRVDFERAAHLADQIGRPEMRVMMEIDLVQTTIKGRPQRI